MPHLIRQTIIRFPEIQLPVRSAHKLRGYFGSLFKEHAPLLNNHLESGDTFYRYPLVQYKVLDTVPTLVGLNEGAELLISLFLNIRELKIDNRVYPLYQKNIESRAIPIGLSGDLHTYRFQTLWMALNQQNYTAYLAESEQQQLKHLKAILIGNMLSFFKAMNYQAEETLMANLQITSQRETKFKNNTMLAFTANFVTNALLPDAVGLGKQTARGFGTILST